MRVRTLCPTQVHSTFAGYFSGTQQTCEQCHWPEKFYGGQLKVFTHYSSDEQNTVRQIRLVIKTGGGELFDKTTAPARLRESQRCSARSGPALGDAAMQIEVREPRLGRVGRRDLHLPTAKVLDQPAQIQN